MRADPMGDGDDDDVAYSMQFPFVESVKID